MSDIPRKKLKLSPKANESDSDFDDWGVLTQDELNAVDEIENQALAASKEPAASRLPKPTPPAKRSTDIAFKTFEKVEQQQHPKTNLSDPGNQRSKIPVSRSRSTPEFKVGTRKLPRQGSVTSKKTLCESSGFNDDIENDENSNSFEMKSLRQQLSTITTQLTMTKDENALSTGQALMLKDKLDEAEKEKKALKEEYQQKEEKFVEEQKNERLKYETKIEQLNTELLFKNEEIRKLGRRSIVDVSQTPVTSSQKKVKSPSKENSFLSRISLSFDVGKVEKQPKTVTDSISNRTEDSTTPTVQKYIRGKEMHLKELRGKIKSSRLVSHVLQTSSESEGLLSLIRDKKENLDSVHKKKSMSPPKISKEGLTRCQVVSFGLNRLLKSANEASGDEAEKLFKTGITTLLPVIQRQILTYVDITRNLLNGKKSLLISPEKYSPDLYASSSSSSSNTSEILLTQQITEQIQLNTVSAIRTLTTLLSNDASLAKNAIATVVKNDEKKDNSNDETSMEIDPTRSTENAKNCTIVNHLASIIGFYRDEGLKMSRLTNPHKDKLILHSALKLLVFLVPHFDEVNLRLLQPHFLSGAFGNCSRLDNRPDIAIANLDVGCTLVSNGFGSWLCNGTHGSCYLSHVNLLCAEVFTFEPRHVATEVLTKIIIFVSHVMSNSNITQSGLQNTDGCCCFTELLTGVVVSMKKHIFKLDLKDTLTEANFNLVRHGLKFLNKIQTHDSRFQNRRQLGQPFYNNLLIKLANMWASNSDRLTNSDFLSVQDLWENNLGGIDRLQEIIRIYSCENKRNSFP